MPDLSVIIVNYKGWKRLKQCLDSLSAVTQNNFIFEVIVVDNASNDGLLGSFRDQYSFFNFIENSGNNGFANGCNAGASIAKGEVLLFLNPDTVVSEQALFAMLQQMYACEKNSIISCRQIKEDGCEEKAYGRFLSPSTLTGWLRALNKIITGVDGREFRQDSSHIYPDWVSGSVIMIRKNDFWNIGKWDEDFWMYYEDVDLCKRARDAGGEIIFLKNVEVEHNHGGASRVNSSITALTKTEVFISRHVYLSKHTKGFKNVYMHTFLVFNNVISLFFPAVFSLIFFFNKKMNVLSKTYTGLIGYYLNSLVYRKWLSRRSVNYRR